MDIRQLHYFEKVARNMKMTKAAEELHISQPSLTNVIKAMEREFGFTLFDRSTRSMALTESGQILYNHAQKILHHFDIFLKDMEEIKQVGKGEITINIIESSRNWIPLVILAFQKKYPEIKFNLKNVVRAKDVEEALINYDIHFALVTHHIENNGLACFPIFSEDIVLLTSKVHPFSHLQSIDLTELRNQNFINYESGFQIQKDFIDACKSANFEPKGTYEVGDLETACSLVKRGLGVTIIPESYVKYSMQNEANLSTVKLKNPSPKRTVYIGLNA
ncbi:LysR family transcriptional regulator [Bacillus oleivorans]|uniref:LysR family transcriptional regulator n=1 Tax=Bacillus oleivorans TaxID=1448271 RepID=UPI0015CE3FF4|nr:LysR family transcriptional regulator [Bacillus oleivorans]